MMNEAVANFFGQRINHSNDDTFYSIFSIRGKISTNENFLKLTTDVIESVQKI